MTLPPQADQPERPVSLELSRQETGTLIGALAWVMGALQIMRDRGHSEADEEFHELHDALMPRLEAALDRIGQARQDSMTHPLHEQIIEDAYAEVRHAFEAWIQLTATDTLSAAVGHRLESANEAGEDVENEPES
jgi:hypothetical protein